MARIQHEHVSSVKVKPPLKVSVNFNWRLGILFWCLMCCWFPSGCSGLVHQRPRHIGSWTGYDFHTYPHPAKRPVVPRDVMVEVVNSLGLKLLAIHNENNENNIAISPYGALSILVALGEGLQGEAVKELQKSAHIPNDIAIIRVGLRDIHRHLKSYFIPKEGFLAGLTLNHDNVTLRPEYEEILRFYGFDIMSFNSALYPDPMTTEKPIMTTTTENSGREVTMEMTSEPVSTTISTRLGGTDAAATSVPPTIAEEITSTNGITEPSTTTPLVEQKTSTTEITSTSEESTVLTTTIGTSTIMPSTENSPVTTTPTKEIPETTQSNIPTTTEIISSAITETTTPLTSTSMMTPTTTESTINAVDSTSTDPPITITTSNISTETTTQEETTTMQDQEGTQTEETSTEPHLDPLTSTITTSETTTEITTANTTPQQEESTEEITTEQKATEKRETEQETTPLDNTEKQSTYLPQTELDITTEQETTQKVTTEQGYTKDITTQQNTPEEITEENNLKQDTTEGIQTQLDKDDEKIEETATEGTEEEDKDVLPENTQEEITEENNLKQDTTEVIQTELDNDEEKVEETATEGSEEENRTVLLEELTPENTQEEITEENNLKQDTTEGIQTQLDNDEEKVEETATEGSEEEDRTVLLEELTPENTQEEITEENNLKQGTTEEIQTQLDNDDEQVEETVTEDTEKEDRDVLLEELTPMTTETTTLLSFPYPDASTPSDIDVTTEIINENEITEDRDRNISKRRIRIKSNNTKPPMSSQNDKRRRKSRSVLDYMVARYYDNQSRNYPQNYHLTPYLPQTQPAFLALGKYREYNVDFMKYDTVLPFFYVSNLKALALSFPLDSSKYYLLLLLPQDPNGIDNLVCNLRLNGSLKYIIEGLRYRHVTAVIPSFMLKGYVNLTPTLQKLGIRRVFEPRQADFSPMTNVRDIYITNIEQAITVNIRNYVDPYSYENRRQFREDNPVEFRADHPFLYFVMDTELNVALMAGKIVNPLNSRIT